MHRYGSVNIHERINLWKQEGWNGFEADTESVENKDTAKAHAEMLAAAEADTSTTRVPPMARNADPSTIVPVEPMVAGEPLIDDEDTAKARPRMAAVPTIEPTV